MFLCYDRTVWLYFDLLFYTCTIKAPPIAVMECVHHTDENVLTHSTQTDTQIPYLTPLSCSVCVSRSTV